MQQLFVYSASIFEEFVPVEIAYAIWAAVGIVFNSNHRSNSFQTNTKSTRPNRISTNHSWSDNY